MTYAGAILKFDNDFHILTFRYKDIKLAMEIPECITFLDLTVFDDTGYMEFNTNQGVESLDLLYDAEKVLTSKQIQTLKGYLKSDRILKVRCDNVSNLDKLKQKAYMCLGDIAFCFDKTETGQYQIVAYNMKNTHQVTVFRVRPDNTFQMLNSSMSDANMYKSLALVERNKQFLIEGLKQWVNTRKKK